MTQALTKSKASQLTNFIQNKKDEIAKILPKSSIEHVTKTALLAVLSNKAIMEKCTIPSIYRSIVQAGLMGLTVGGSDGYLIPYGNTCTFGASYIGWSKLARRSEGIDVIRASIVYSNDEFEMSEQPPMVRHVPARNSRGELEGAVAVAYSVNNKNHELFDFTFVSAEELSEAKRQADSKKPSPAWKYWPNEMRKKVAIRRLCKMLPKNDALERLIKLESDTDNGIINIPDPAIPSDMEQLENRTTETKVGPKTESNQIIDAKIIDAEFETEKENNKKEKEINEQKKTEKKKEKENKSNTSKLKARMKNESKKEEIKENQQEENPDYGSLEEQEDIEF